jgi:hypothetical protein
MGIARRTKISYLFPKGFLTLSYIGRINSSVAFGTLRHTIILYTVLFSFCYIIQKYANNSASFISLLVVLILCFYVCWAPIMNVNAKWGLIECADLVASIMNKDGISAMIVKRRTIL